MRIKEILSRGIDFPTVATDDTLTAAATAMKEADVRAVAVVEDDRLLGILTDWDIVEAMADRADEISSLPVSAVMTHEPLITIDFEASVGAATELLAEKEIHHLPVINGGKYVGMICLGLQWSEQEMLAPPVRATLTARHP